MAWAMNEGKDLRDYMTQRYSSSMVFMSLLLSTELGVLFNSSSVPTDMRDALVTENMTSLSFWAGIVICFSAILTILSLISIFTAWTMVSAVSPTNAHCVLRSSIGQYAAELPGRFIVSAIYSFLLWLMIFFFILLPVGFWSIFLSTTVVILFIHVITTFSAFGRIIMHSGAMGSNRIFDELFEASLLPHGLHANLLTKAKANLANNTSITRQYRSKSQARPIDRSYDQDELVSLLSGKSNLSGTSTDRSPSVLSDSGHNDNAYPYSGNYLYVNSNPINHGKDINSKEPHPLLKNSSSNINKTNSALERPGHPVRKRTESLVKFADGLDTNGERYDLPPTTSAKSRGVQHATNTINRTSTTSAAGTMSTPKLKTILVNNDGSSPAVSAMSDASPTPQLVSSLRKPKFPPSVPKPTQFGRKQDLSDEDEDVEAANDLPPPPPPPPPLPLSHNHLVLSTRRSDEQAIGMVANDDGGLFERWLSASERSTGEFSATSVASTVSADDDHFRRREDEKSSKEALMYPRKLSSMSINSSLDGLDASDMDGLTEEEKFELEYGPWESARVSDRKSYQMEADESQREFADEARTMENGRTDRHDPWSASEGQRLLGKNRLEYENPPNGYLSFDRRTC